MRNLFVTASLLAFAYGTSIACADNAGVENAIKSQPDLSGFYQVLVGTGVNHELQPGQSYTVFAPTDEVFARIRQDQYPCFYEAECQAQVAAIVRNHIIPGTVHINDAAKHEGGLFSIGDRIVHIGEPSRNAYAVDGNHILSMSSFSGGALYKIDGVIANPHELASLQNAEYISAPKEVTTVSKKTIPYPACGTAGCPDALTEATTITRTVEEPSVATAPLLSPAR